MKRSTLAINVLVVLLVVSNVWWWYEVTTERFLRVAYIAERAEALTQIFALVPVVAQRPSRARVIATATEGTLNKEAYEKDGYVWVGSLGLKFTNSGQLAEVVTSFSVFPRTKEQRQRGEHNRHSTGIMAKL